MVVYGGVAIVASGVLPLDQVAGQPLTLVAKNILNPALFTVFMIGGPVLALSSSINSVFRLHSPVKMDGFRNHGQLRTEEGLTGN